MGAGLVDALSSDYMPVSLLHSVFLLHDCTDIPLPELVSMVSSAPAKIVGLDERGTIAPGFDADLVRVRRAGFAEVVRGVWRGGERVM